MKPTECPFQLDEQATRYLAAATQHPPEGCVAGIWTGLGRIEKNKTGRILSEYDGEHWFVGFDNEQRLLEKGFMPVTIDNITFLMHSTAIERLRGSTLTYDNKNKILKQIGQPSPPPYGSPAAGSPSGEA